MGLFDKCKKVKNTKNGTGEAFCADKKAHTEGKLGNKGMSFVEIIVVIAIMAIVAGGTMAVTGLISSGDAKKAAKTVGTQLNDLKNKTLSIYGSWQGEIGLNADDVFEVCIVKNGEVFERTPLGSRIDVSFYAGGDTSGKDVTAYSKEYTLSGTDKLVIVYSQSTGAIESVKVGSDNAMDYDPTSGVIRVASGDNIYMLKLYYKTGKIVAEY